MGKHSKLAINYFKEGYNCAQSVLLAFQDITNFDKTTSLKLASSFGGGFSRLREVCGVVSAMSMIIGLLGEYDSIDDEIKAKHYKKTQDLILEFQKRIGSYLCREILNLEEKNSSPIPSKRTEEYYKTRPCENCVKVASEIIEEYLIK